MADLGESAAELSVPDVLNRLRGRRVTLMLANGSAITGSLPPSVDFASSHVLTVPVLKLEGKEYFDALVPKSTIVGVSYRRPEDG